MEQITAYHGDVRPYLFRQVPAYQFTPDASGHLRVHTVRDFQAPYRATWWIYTSKDMRPKGTSGSPNMDGLHTHFHHLNNNANYNLHSVRRDGNAKLDFENGLEGYTSVGWRGGQALPLRIWRNYMFTLDVGLSSAEIHVSNDEKSDPSISLSWTLDRKSPIGGNLGWRLDNIHGYLGGITVREY